MTSWHGSTFHTVGPLWGESTSDEWFPSQKASNAKFWCFLIVRLKKLLNKQWRYRWFNTMMLLWSHYRPTYQMVSPLRVPVHTWPYTRPAVPRVVGTTHVWPDRGSLRTGSLLTALHVMLQGEISQIRNSFYTYAADCYMVFIVFKLNRACHVGGFDWWTGLEPIYNT